MCGINVVVVFVGHHTLRRVYATVTAHRVRNECTNTDEHQWGATKQLDTHQNTGEWSIRCRSKDSHKPECGEEIGGEHKQWCECCSQRCTNHKQWGNFTTLVAEAECDHGKEKFECECPPYHSCRGK